MSRQAMQESLRIDLKHQLEARTISLELHKRATAVIEKLTVADWKDIDNMSTVAASEMVLDIARNFKEL